MMGETKPAGALQMLLTRQVVALCLALLLAFISSGIFFPVLPVYMKTLGATGTMVGLIVAAYAVGEGIFGLLWGSWADRIGITIPLTVQSFGAAACIAAFAFIPVLGAAYLLRFLMAAAISAIWPTGRGFLAYSVPPGSKGLAMALFAVLASGGMSVGALISGVLVDNWGYPVVFLASALLSFAGGIIVVTQLRGARIVRRIPAAQVPAAVSAAGENGGSVRPIVILSTIVTLVAAVFSSVSTFVPLLMTSVSGLKQTDVGVVFGVAGAASLVLMIPIGRLSDRVGRRRVLVGGLCLLLVAVVGLAYARAFWPIMLFAVLNSVGRWTTDPPILSLLSDITPLRYQGRSQGIYVVACDIGIGAGPLAVGATWDMGGPMPAYLLCAAIVAAALAVSLLLVREKEWLAQRLEALSIA